MATRRRKKKEDPAPDPVIDEGTEEKNPPPKKAAAKKAAFPPRLEEENLMKMIVFSPAGHGKTTLLGTGVGDDRISPMLLLDFEGGLKSIKSKFKRIDINDLGKVPCDINMAHAVKIREWEDFNIVYNFLADDDHDYKSVGIDSLSEVNYLNLTTIVGEAIDANDAHDKDIAYRDDYMRSIAQMRRLIRFFRDLPLHVFFTSAALEVEDARTRKMQYRPALTGRLVMELPGLVDTIGYLAVVEEKGEEDSFRSLCVQPTERYMAKDRSEGGILGDYLDRPNLPWMLDILLGEAPPNIDEEEEGEE
jgi:hypothetical protein